MTGHETATTTTKSPEEATVATPPRFGALRERDYRLLLIGESLSQMGDAMEMVARGWLVLELTNSPFALGLVGFSQGIPRLFLALMAGVLADRVDRRQLLIACSVLSFVVALIFATLVATQIVELWHVLGLVMLSASCTTLNLVSRHAMIPDTVSRANLPNAVALSATARQTTAIVGQALAGLLIVVIGVSGVLYVNAASFLAMLVALLLMRIPTRPLPAERLGFREDLRRGLEFVWSRRDLSALILLGLVPWILIQPYRTLMPIFARDILEAGSTGYGLLMAASGAGGIVSAAVLSIFAFQRRGALMLLSLLTISVGLVVFSLASTFPVAVAALMLVGLSMNVYRITNNTLLQLLTPREMMGRVIGIYQTEKGLQPAGSLLFGWLAAVASAPLAVVSGALTCALVTVAVIAFRPAVRRL